MPLYLESYAAYAARMRHIMAPFMALIATACITTSSSSYVLPSASPTLLPSPRLFSDAHDVVMFWQEHAPPRYGGSCDTMSGRAYCQGITVEPVRQQYVFVVILYAHDGAAEKAFHKSCDALRDPEPAELVWMVDDLAGWAELVRRAQHPRGGNAARGGGPRHRRRARQLSPHAPLFDDLKVARLWSV